MDQREKMVEEIKAKYGLNSPRVYKAMLKVPREEFAPLKYSHLAYKDQPIPIGFGQTMSQPFTVAFMTHLLDLSGDEKVLEVGTGSGYQAAVLSKLAKAIYSIEIVPQLSKKAKNVLKKLKIKNVWVKQGSGEWGWKEKAPFDSVIVTAGLDEVPGELLDQLKVNRVLVAPIGKGVNKEMTRLIKREGGVFEKNTYGVFHFVPFVEESN